AGAVLAGVGEDEDEAQSDVDGGRALGMDPYRGWFGHGPGVEAAGPAVGDGLGLLDDLVEGLLVEDGGVEARHGAGDGGGHGGARAQTPAVGIAERMSSSTSASGSPMACSAAVRPATTGPIGSGAVCAVPEKSWLSIRVSCSGDRRISVCTPSACRGTATAGRP